MVLSPLYGSLVPPPTEVVDVPPPGEGKLIATSASPVVLPSYANETPFTVAAADQSSAYNSVPSVETSESDVISVAVPQVMAAAGAVRAIASSASRM